MMNPHDLPIYQQKAKILEALAANQVIVVESPTGSGKTTQLPIILHEAGYASNGIIGITQPRRIATLSVSDFIARQLSTTVPGIVGYKMRFEDATAPNTAIKIMTDGILLQEMKLDPYLTHYSVIMVDEAHERSLNIDFILGLLKKVLEARSEFRVIVSSATINAEVFSEYFGECPVVRIDAPMYPVRVVYDAIKTVPEASPGQGPRPQGPDGGYYRSSDEAIYDKILSIVGRVLDGDAGAEPGDILIFLPGEKTIKECLQTLMASRWALRLHCIPLYARLGKDEQEKVFAYPPEGKIKVVISTNIAETSVTIDGITVVVDSGLAKINYYNPRTFTASLIETPISKASCNQRKGRAGRTRPGICYRLYSIKDFDSRPLYPTEEIHRTDLSEVLLRMAELGITDFEHFDFITKPPKSAIRGAIEVLNLLDALNPDRTLTRIGEMMCAFPLLPKLSRMIVEAVLKYPDVISETLIASAFLSTTSPYVLPPGEETEARAAHHRFRDPMGDFASYLQLYEAFSSARDKTKFCERNYLDERTLREIVRIKEQLELIVSELGVPIASGGAISDYLCAVSRGLIQFVCARQGRGMFSSLTAERIQIHPGSVMFRQDADFIVAGEIVRTTRMYAMSVSPLSKAQLYRISPELAEQLIAIRQKRPAADRNLRTPKERGRERIAEKSAQGEALHENGRGKRKSEKQRVEVSTGRKLDTISLGGEVFPIEGKNQAKRTVLLDWERLSKVAPLIGPADEEFGKGLRARVEWGKVQLFNGEKLSTVIKALKWIDIGHDLTANWPQNTNFSLEGRTDSAEQTIAALAKSLEMILHVTKFGKSGKFGFIGLYSDGTGNFWYQPTRSFSEALNQSLASTELLVDYAEKLSVSASLKEKISALYRRLSDFFNAL
jgi:RNA helicase HrpA